MMQTAVETAINDENESSMKYSIFPYFEHHSLHKNKVFRNLNV